MSSRPSARSTANPIPYVDLGAQFASERATVMAAIERVLVSGMLVGGDAIAAVEAKVAKRCGTEHAIAVNSGTDALILGLRAMSIGPGDEVITPPNSFVASTGAIVAVGATPVFADVEDDQNIDPRAVEKAITPRTKAIMPVHLTGRICEMDAIMALAQRRDIDVIEDAAQSFGSTYRGRPAGSFGRVGCLSAHPLKNFNAAGDGGFVVTDDAGVAERVRLYRNHGLADRNTVTTWGTVSRMDTIQAAVLLNRLDSFDFIVARRREIAARYRARLDTNCIYVPPERPDTLDTYHTFVVQLDRRDALQTYLAERGIGTAIHYPIPIHLQPAAKSLGYQPGSFPVTERQAGRILSLPIHQMLDDDDIDAVCAAIEEFYA
jgi:dTDP-4-amino-4,6-dideoxygalactose transaminase